jgi:hexosaminidase
MPLLRFPVIGTVLCGMMQLITVTPVTAQQPAVTPRSNSAPHTIIPAPRLIESGGGDRFTITDSTPVTVRSNNSDAQRIGHLLATMLGGGNARTARIDSSSGYPASSPGNATGGVVLSLDSTLDVPTEEGYTLTVNGTGVTISARAPTGLFYGVQTLRQLLPWSVEHRAALNRRLTLPAVRIVDAPRYVWRGAMLDVARHFLPLEDVKRFLDVMALYKLNTLHLHLADDQGWRLEILSHPRLATHGGSLQVGGGAGGYYTQADYTELVQYARDRFITIVPEIDMPGHTNAALASVPWLNCDSIAPPLYTGIRVGFSALCARAESTYAWVDDVVRELAALTPGPYLHLGGDEVEKLSRSEYLRFVERVEGIVRAHGKRMIGWGEIAPANLHPSTIVQHWRTDARASRDSAHLHAARGGTVIMSPGNRTYLDMKYDSTTTLGLRWAGMISVQHAYSWNPSAFLPRVAPAAVLGVEAPLWAETIEKRSDYEYLAFPRLIAIAEVGWSEESVRGWTGFRTRLGAHGPRLQALGVNFHRASEIPWRER